MRVVKRLTSSRSLLVTYLAVSAFILIAALAISFLYISFSLSQHPVANVSNALISDNAGTAPASSQSTSAHEASVRKTLSPNETASITDEARIAAASINEQIVGSPLSEVSVPTPSDYQKIRERYT